ncbi:hypothetical protein ACLIBG_08055 [Virgibacillus sp. W0181]|uniref:hypothetical protein n=1 Tax=Virgibacillus sp. W0181 TaxID=3391581 RepID=UPI003F46430D
MLNLGLEQTERKMDPFWWVYMFLAYTFVLLLGIACIIGPFVLFFIFKSYWLLLLIPLIPLGWWMTRGMIRVIKKYIWLNRHNSTYSLKNNVFSFKEWNKTTKDVIEGTISIDQIDYIVVANYTFQDNHAYARAGVTEEVPKNTRPPIIYVVLTMNDKKQVLSIPFYENHTVDPWLKKFKEAKIAFYYTAHDIRGVHSEDKVALFENEDLLIFYDYNGAWENQVLDLYNTWIEEKVVPYQSEEVDGENDQTSQANKHEASPEKLPFSKWARIAAVLYLLYAVGLYITVILAEKEFVNAESPLPGFILLFILSIIYFWMFRKHLRWHYMIRFCVEAFIATFIVSVIFGDKDPITNEMFAGLTASTIFFILIVWIPYLIIRFAKKKFH